MPARDFTTLLFNPAELMPNGATVPTVPVHRLPEFIQSMPPHSRAPEVLEKDLSKFRPIRTRPAQLHFESRPKSTILVAVRCFSNFGDDVLHKSLLQVGLRLTQGRCWQRNIADTMISGCDVQGTAPSDAQESPTAFAVKATSKENRTRMHQNPERKQCPAHQYSLQNLDARERHKRGNVRRQRQLNPVSIWHRHFMSPMNE